MAHKKFKSVREVMIGSPADWVKRFKIEDYQDNTPMIEKLYEEKQLAMLQSRDFQGKLDSLREKLQVLEFENQSLRHQLDSSRQNSWIAFGLSLLAIVLMSVGTGQLVKNSERSAGWLLAGSGCILEIFSFVLTKRSRNGKGQ